MQQPVPDQALHLQAHGKTFALQRGVRGQHLIPHPETRFLPKQQAGFRVREEVLAAHAALERERFAMRLTVQRLIWNRLLRNEES